MRRTFALLAFAALTSAAINETIAATTTIEAMSSDKVHGVGDVCAPFTPCPGWTFPYCGSGHCGGVGAECESDNDCMDACVDNWLIDPETASCVPTKTCGSTPAYCPSAQKSKPTIGARSKVIARWR